MRNRFVCWFLLLELLFEAEEILISTQTRITAEEAINEVIIVNELLDLLLQVELKLRYEGRNNQVKIVLLEFLHCQNAELIFFHRKLQSCVFLLLLNPFHVLFVDKVTILFLVLTMTQASEARKHTHMMHGCLH